MLEKAQDIFGDCDHNVQVEAIEFKDDPNIPVPQTHWEDELYNGPRKLDRRLRWKSLP